jgi:hypothetical protein
MLPRKFALLALLLGLAALILCFGFGCGSDDDAPTSSTNGDDTNGDDDIIDQDSLNREISMELVTEANDSLGRQMNEIINETIGHADSSFRPGDIDFSGVSSLYEEALDYWADNPDAKFGVAFCGLMLFCGDPDLNQLVEDFKHYYDTMSFNPMAKVMLLPEVSLGHSQKIFPDGIPATPGGVMDIMPAVTRLDKMVIFTSTAVPAISDIQYNLENNLLPRIISAEECLVDLLADPDYTFTITPMMQGNPGASPIVLDQSDLSLFLGVAYAAEAALHVFFSRNLDVAAYNAEAVEDAVNQGSDFLTLKGGDVGEVHLASAKDRLLSAEAQLETTVDYLLAEIGTDQTYDLISVYPDDEADLRDIKDSLIHYRGFMDEVSELMIFYNTRWYCYWNGDDIVCDRMEDTLILDVALWEFFDNPMEDPKEFLPGYTVTLQAEDDYFKTFADAHFDRQRYWDALYDIYGLVYPYDTSSTQFPYFSNHLPDGNTDEFYRLIGEYPEFQQFVFGWDDVQFWGGDPVYLWNYYSSNQWSYYSYYSSPDQLCACYEWTANSFEEWLFPDPTFNGLLPNYTNMALKDFLMGDLLPSDWDKSGCDYLNLSIDW